MSRSRKLLITGVMVLALGAAGVGIAQAVGRDGDSEEQVIGPEADQAKRAAAESIGGGRVVGVERENEGNAAWEVEVVRRDGRQVEVDLASNLERVGVESDDDGAGDESDSSSQEDESTDSP
jgi:uncharacterized membrane protein YkoI